MTVFEPPRCPECGRDMEWDQVMMVWWCDVDRLSVDPEAML